MFAFNPQTAGVPYTEQNHLHRQRQEFHIWKNAQKTKQNDVKTILFSLAYLTLIKLPFCMSTGEREGERQRQIFFYKKKKKKKFKIGPKPFYIQVNDKEWHKKKKKKKDKSTFRCREMSETAVWP